MILPHESSKHDTKKPLYQLTVTPVEGDMFFSDIQKHACGAKESKTLHTHKMIKQLVFFKK